MKTLLILFIALSGIGGSVAVLTYQKPTVTEVAVLRDITDKELAQPDAGTITGLFDLSDRWNGAVFRYADINEVSYNQVSEVTLPSENKWLSNELERNREVAAFTQHVKTVVTTDEQERVGKAHSSVYFAIASSLVTLTQSMAQKRVLVVYSDLMENTPTFSFYDQRNFSLLQTEPDVIAKQLVTQQPLPSLQGITVYLIYQPADVETDAQFRVASAFYQSLLEGRGATVIISANLTN